MYRKVGTLHSFWSGRELLAPFVIQQMDFWLLFEKLTTRFIATKFYHHHHGVPTPHITLTLAICSYRPGKSSRRHPVSVKVFKIIGWGNYKIFRDFNKGFDTHQKCNAKLNLFFLSVREIKDCIFWARNLLTSMIIFLCFITTNLVIVTL